MQDRRGYQGVVTCAEYGETWGGGGKGDSNPSPSPRERPMTGWFRHESRIRQSLFRWYYWVCRAGESIAGRIPTAMREGSLKHMQGGVRRYSGCHESEEIGLNGG